MGFGLGADFVTDFFAGLVAVFGVVDFAAAFGTGFAASGFSGDFTTFEAAVFAALIVGFASGFGAALTFGLGAGFASGFGAALASGLGLGFASGFGAALLVSGAVVAASGLGLVVSGVTATTTFGSVEAEAGFAGAGDVCEAGSLLEPLGASSVKNGPYRARL